MSALLAEFESGSLEQTQSIAGTIYPMLQWPACVYLCGDMGAGKTTLSQALIAAAGYQGAVTSPTYNLIHEYPVEIEPAASANSEQVSVGGTIYHMDLYRLNDPEELEFLGVADLWSARSLFLVEWPERAKGILQEPHYVVEISKKYAKTEEVRNIHIYQTF